MALVSRVEKKTIFTHLVQFFFLGLVMGIIEDVLAIYFATDAPITIHTFKVAFLVALPFAIIGEILVDSKLLRKVLKKIGKGKK